MACKEWQLHLEDYRLATRVYDLAVAALNSGPEFKRAWENAEKTRQDCSRSRAALLHHEHEHACVKGTERSAATTASDTKGHSGG